MGDTTSCKSALSLRAPPPRLPPAPRPAPPPQERGWTQFIRAVALGLGPGLSPTPGVLTPRVQGWPQHRVDESLAQAGLRVWGAPHAPPRFFTVILRFLWGCIGELLAQRQTQEEMTLQRIPVPRQSYGKCSISTCGQIYRPEINWPFSSLQEDPPPAHQKPALLARFGALFCVTRSYHAADFPEEGNRFTSLGVC